MFITVKAIAKLNLGHRNKFEIELYKITVVVHVLQTTQNWSFHVVVLQRTAEKCTKSYNARAQLLFCLLILLFSDVPVAVVVILRSGNTGNIFLQLVLQHCCSASWNSLLRVLCTSQIEASTSLPGNPPDIWIFGKSLFKFPLPGLKSCSNVPTRTCLWGRGGGLFHWQRLVIAPRKLFFIL